MLGTSLHYSRLLYFLDAVFDVWGIIAGLIVFHRTQTGSFKRTASNGLIVSPPTTKMTKMGNQNTSKFTQK